MKSLLSIILIFLTIPLVAASSIDITLENDLAIHDFLIQRQFEDNYDAFVYISEQKPDSVIYDGTYQIRETQQQYEIIFEKELAPGENSIAFSLVYPNDQNGIYRASFSEIGPATVTLKLPYGALLDKNPSTIPPYHDISSDGSHILLSWNFEENPTIAVFYVMPHLFGGLYLAFLLIVVMALLFHFFHRKKTQKMIDQLLTVDENNVMTLIKQGISKQSQIAKQLQFSKSKMSKIVRKLEQKKLIKKEPHFKTNILEII